MDEYSYEQHSDFCSSFSHPKRLEILDILRDKEMTVSEIQAKMLISTTNLSQHLSLMKNRGMLGSRREGQHVYYYVVSKKVLQAYDLIQEVILELMNKKLSSLK